MHALKGRDAAEARAGAYVLLADVLANGPQRELLEPASMSSFLAPLLTQPIDDLAADHQHVFGFCVRPLEGLFLDAEGSGGGVSNARVRGTFAAIGYQADPTRDEPEHLATELRALGVLCGAEADAIEDHNTDVVSKLHRLQEQLLHTHILRWLPVLATAVYRVGRPFPTALIRQISQLSLLHAEQLGADYVPLPETVDAIDLDDSNVDLRDIARFLTTPARAGILFSKADIATVGRTVSVPRGFGSRALLMQNLLRAGARFDVLAITCEQLIRIVDSQNAEFESWPRSMTECWRERAELTRRTLATVRDAGFQQDDE